MAMSFINSMTLVGVGSFVHCLRVMICFVFKQMNLWEPCRFDIGPRAMAGDVQGVIVLVMLRGLCTCTYVLIPI